jgi:DnaJ-class molecular chaperone
VDSTVTCADCGSTNVDERRSPCPECESSGGVRIIRIILVDIVCIVGELS